MGDAPRGADRLGVLLAALASAGAPFFLGAILVALIIFAWPSVVWNGLHFFTSVTWSIGNLYSGVPVVRHGYAAAPGASYGMVAFLLGTLLSAALALLFAGPVGTGVAMWLAEFSDRRTSQALGFMIELLAGVPSVVFGLWGFVVLVPWIGSTAGPALARVLGFVPIFRGPVETGAGLLASGMVLAAMILPIIAAMGRDMLRSVPQALREQGRALGLTDWEVVRDLVWPVAAPGFLAAYVLALGRALGETMAVVMVSGNAVNVLPVNIYSPIATIASTILALLDSALTDATGMAVHALAELAMVLFVITVAVNLLVPTLVRRLLPGGERNDGALGDG